ncbi:root allergen protein-like [Cynara cardunculus var. scolymus]|uniref:Bet v I domain-containing protein n=1 Tax=Cynara cardunculus var. scolymus TaxID=59895 RepID=A0A103WSC4_CYNCS|nr:root allergen protein-like [Cynara cardunculus var. scolymus]KVH77599.1 Bet v I domain-containing protein [Cynara cardunculus var. scolymus]
MAVVTIEVEVTSSLPAPKLFKVFSHFDTIAPKVEPETFKTVSVIQGDGGVGSIKNITYGDGVPYTTSKHTVDAIDSSNLSLSYTVFEGDALLGIIDSATHHIKFIPSSDGGSIYKHAVVCKCKGDAKLTEDTPKLFKEALKKTFKAIESYAIAHPDEAY